MIHNSRQERQVVADALKLKSVERITHMSNRRFTRWRPCTELCDHWIVIHRDFAALVNARIVAHRKIPFRRITLPFAVD